MRHRCPEERSTQHRTAVARPSRAVHRAARAPGRPACDAKKRKCSERARTLPHSADNTKTQRARSSDRSRHSLTRARSRVSVCVVSCLSPARVCDVSAGEATLWRSTRKRAARREAGRGKPRPCPTRQGDNAVSQNTTRLAADAHDNRHTQTSAHPRIASVQCHDAEACETKIVPRLNGDQGATPLKVLAVARAPHLKG